LKDEDYYTPPPPELDILEGHVIQMQLARTSLWEKVTKSVKEVEVLRKYINSILSEVSRVDKFVFKSLDEAYALDPVNILSMKQTIEDLDSKVQYLSKLCNSDIDHLKSQLLRIRKEVAGMETKSATRNEMETKKQTEKEKKIILEKQRRESLELELRPEIQELQQM